MNCERCGGRSSVLETRTDRDKVGANEFGTVFRRRKCQSCNITWTTTEIRDDRIDDHDVQRRAERAEGKIKIARQALMSIIEKL